MIEIILYIIDDIAYIKDAVDKHWNYSKDSVFNFYSDLVRKKDKTSKGKDRDQKVIKQIRSFKSIKIR